MLMLTYEELANPCSLTYKSFDKIQSNIDLLEKKMTRLKDFHFALTEHLRACGKMDYEMYNRAVAWLEHSDLTISEIMEKIQ